MPNNDDKQKDEQEDQGFDLNGLSDIWRSGGNEEAGENSLPEFDYESAVKSAKLVFWRMRILFVMEVLVAFIGAGLCLYLLTKQTLPTTIFGIVGSCFCAVSGWYAYVARKDSWSGSNETAQGVLKLQIARAEGAIRYINLNIKLTIPAILLFVSAMWTIVDKHGWASSKVMKIGLFYAVMIVGFFILYKYAVRVRATKTDDIQAYKKLLEELSEE